jgi:hypothetical protein
MQGQYWPNVPAVYQIDMIWIEPSRSCEDNIFEALRKAYQFSERCLRGSATVEYERTNIMAPLRVSALYDLLSDVALVFRYTYASVMRGGPAQWRAPVVVQRDPV